MLGAQEAHRQQDEVRGPDAVVPGLSLNGAPFGLGPVDGTVRTPATRPLPSSRNSLVRTQ
jgi:hypothetical protein